MSDIQVNAGQDLQAAIDNAQPGDSISLQAGASFLGPYTFPAKSGFVTVRSSQITSFPQARVISSLPYAKLVVDNVEAAIIARPGGSFWKFEGIEVATTNPSLLSYGLVRIGESDQQAVNVPHHFTFDRCYIHGLPTQNVQRGITMNGAYVEVVNSRIDDIHWVGVEAQAIGCWNGPGPFKIINNHLAAAGINILFGGAAPSIPDLVPSDIEIRDNVLFKPLSWRVGDPSYAGYHWTAKNLLELKSARRVVIDNNLMENSWADSQVGWAIIFNVTDDSGNNAIDDVQLTRNTIRHSANGINLRGSRDACDAVRLKRINIADNTLEDIGAYNGESKPLQFLSGSEDVTVEHNTIEARHSVMILESCAALKHLRFSFKSNLANHGTYGVFGDGGTLGTNALDKYCADWKFEKNALYNIGPSGVGTGQYPADNYFPVALGDAQGLLGTDGQPVGVRVTAPPPVDPTPTPPPVTTKKVAWPKTEGAQDKVLADQWALGYRMKRNLSGAYAEFEKVK